MRIRLIYRGQTYTRCIPISSHTRQRLYAELGRPTARFRHIGTHRGRDLYM